MRDNRSKKGKTQIAVIGLSCYYPGAKSPLELWENILSQRRQFRRMPDVRLPIADYYDANLACPDKTYQKKAAVIEGYQFDWLKHRIPKQVFEHTDIVQWLALDVASRAIEDANLDLANISKEKIGVVLGNTLTGEFTRANTMRLRYPYVRRALKKSCLELGQAHLFKELDGILENYYKSVFAPISEDTLAGGLANTIAGRICNYFDFHGGGYIVDGACASSLLAVINAANYLVSGAMDLVITGGVDVSLDTFELIGFAKTGALTPDEMRVYDKKAKGFIPGEGCGMVVLKRLEDAQKDGDKVYAVLEGWGISSDGKGGITAPTSQWQGAAIKRAHQMANIDPKELDFIEGHGTGTTVGDKVELKGIALALEAIKTQELRTCGVTSLKSLIGHTKAAAGIGAFIKTVIALNQRIVPPTAGIEQPNDIFYREGKMLFPVLKGITKQKTAMYAGVSAMGFGGINSHCVLSSGFIESKKFKTAISPKQLFVSNQTHEIFLFAGLSIEELVQNIEKIKDLAFGISYAELSDLAAFNNINHLNNGKFRGAIIAQYPEELSRQLEQLLNSINQLSENCLLYTSPSPRDATLSRMPSSA